MMKNNTARLVSTGGILAALAVLFQASPVFLPAVGFFLSPIATLPVALAAADTALMGASTYLSSTLILLLVSPEEAAVFFFTTGAFGLALGISRRKKAAVSAGISAITLFSGINVLIYVIGINAFGDMTPSSLSIWGTVWILLFSLIYAGFWRIILRFSFGRLKAGRNTRTYPADNK